MCLQGVSYYEGGDPSAIVEWILVGRQAFEPPDGMCRLLGSTRRSATSPVLPPLSSLLILTPRRCQLRSYLVLEPGFSLHLFSPLPAVARSTC